MDVSITKMSSKGQIVIPAEMRKGIKEGEKLVLIKNKDQIILKSVNNLEKNLKEDLMFAKKTEEAWKRHDADDSVQMDKEEFLQELEKW